MALDQILHYKVQRKIGQGGMGEVYLATDTKLNRQVALKFVPETLAPDQEARTRLLREAQAASQLVHPNIVTVHSIEHADGRDFIVMEYVPGQTLHDYFHCKSRSIDEALSLSIQIVEALQKAHAAGVIHRDLKPGNVLMDADGRPRVLDFGLAKIEGAAKLTRSGSTVGTMAYISPEQAQGREVDHRSDLFSFGVVLYEMIACRLPFSGEHEAALVYAIANDEPEPLARFKSGVPDDVQRVVSKCLAKRPEERYQSASDLLADLKRIHRISQSGPSLNVTVATRRSRKSWLSVVGALAVITVLAILFAPRWFETDGGGQVEAGAIKLAVLPFQNVGATEDEYFADGITDELIARLSSVTGLSVISRNSVMPYKGTDLSIAEIGNELGVRYILTGTIRWQKHATGNDRVRITPELVETVRGKNVWAQVYDEELTDVFHVQSDVAEQVIAALNLTLLEPDRDRLKDVPTENLQAYDYYLRGNEYFRLIRGGTEAQALRLAAQLYQQAIDLDSTFVAAHARLGRCYTELHWHNTNSDEDLRLAREHLETALRLGPNDSEARTAKGSLYYHQLDYENALRELAAVLKLNPNNSDVMMELGYVYRRTGKFREAVDQMLAAVELDPRNINYYQSAAASLSHLREYDRAEELLEKAISLAPERGGLYGDLAAIYLDRDGDARRAVDLLEKMAASVSVDITFNDSWGTALQYLGDYDAARQKFRAIQKDNSRIAVAWLKNAMTFYVSGQRDSATAYFHTARDTIEARRTDWTSPFQALGDLGLVYAGLGDRERALQLGRAATDSLRNDFTIWEHRQRLAFIHILLGDEKEALDLVDTLLSNPGYVSVQTIRLHPMYRLLEDHPRYKALIAAHDVT